MGKRSRSVAFGLCVFVLGFSSVYAQRATTRAGFDVSLVMPEGGLNTTIGFGGVLDYGWSLGSAGAIHFHPNAELWFAGGDRYFRDYYGQYYGGSDFETALNFEGRYNFPLPSSSPVRPYIGLGPAIVLSYFHYDYNFPTDYGYSYHHSGADFGFNILGGIDFRLGQNAMAYAEMKGKVGGYVDVFKLTFGMMFPLGRSY